MVKLTPREYDVLIRLCMNSNTIADELGITIHTVKVFYRVLAKKLGVNTRSAIIVRALRLGLIDLDMLIL